MKTGLKIATPFDYDDRDPRAKMIRETSLFLSLVLGDPELLRQMPSLPRFKVGQERRWSHGFSRFYYAKVIEYFQKLSV